MWLDAEPQKIPGKSDLAGAVRHVRWRWHASAVTSMMAGSSQQQCRENEIRLWLWAEKTGSSLERLGGEKLPCSIRSYEPPRRTASSPRHTCATSSPASARIPVNRLHELLPWNIARPVTHSVAA